MKKTALKVLILDFDGIILESSVLKTDAYREFFKRFPEVYEQAIEYHYANKGMSRYNQFRHLCTLLGIPASDEEIRRLSGEFSVLVMEKMDTCPYVEGMPEFLEFFDKKVPMHVASNSPQNELTEIIGKRGLSRFFETVSGTTSNEQKTQMISSVLKKTGCRQDEALFIGDTKKDLAAAQETGVGFIGRDNQMVRFDDDTTSFDTMKQIKEYILEMYSWEEV